MAKVGTAEVEVEISKAKVRREADAAGREIEESLGKSAQKASKELEDKLGQIRIGAGIGVAAGVGLGLGAATKAASDLNETTSKSAAVFGEAQSAVSAYAKEAAQGIGLSERAALDAVSTFGNLFTQLGVGQEEAANLSTEMVTLAADFGSFFNEDPARIIEAQTAAFRGEYDALQKYVPTISDAAVKQRALADTGKANADSLTQQEKALAVYALMIDGAGAAQGDFARTSDSAANAAKRAGAEIDNSAASLGQALLPVASAAAEVVGTLASAFGDLPGPLQTGIVGVGGLTLATGLLLPKLVEGAQLMKLAGSKAIDFATGTGQAAGSTSKLGRALGTAGLVGAVAGATFALNEYREAMNKVRVDGEGLLAATDKQIADEITLASKAGILGKGEFEEIGKGNIEVLYAMRDALKANGDEAIPELEAAIKSVEAGMSRAEARTDKYADAQKDLAGTNTDLAGTFGAVNEALAGIYKDGVRANQAFAGYLQSSLDVNQAVIDVAEAEDQLAEANKGVADAQRDIADAQEGVVQARRGVADAEEAVTDALRGVEEARQKVTDAERDAVDARVRVVDATQELAQAEQDALIGSDYMAASLEAVSDAEETLALRQADSQTAQENLTAARANYGQVLEDLARDAAGAADDVLSAEIRLRDAQENLATLGDDERAAVAAAQKRLADLDATASAEQRAAAEEALAKAIANMPDADDRLAAEIAVREASRRLAEARLEAAAAEKEAAEQAAAGVDGSDAVVAALGAVETAADNEAEAQSELEAAVLGVASTQVEANARVQTAQENLEAAIRDRTEADRAVVDAKQGVVDANGEVQKATEGVRDANRDVATAIDGVVAAQGRYAEAKDAAKAAQGEVERAVDDVKDALEEQATAWLGVATTFKVEGTLRTAVRGITGELKELAGNYDVNVNIGGNAAASILSGVSNPFLEVLAAVTGVDDGKTVGDKAVTPGKSAGFWADSAVAPVPAGGLGKTTSTKQTNVNHFHGITDYEEAAELMAVRSAWRLSLIGAA